MKISTACTLYMRRASPYVPLPERGLSDILKFYPKAFAFSYENSFENSTSTNAAACRKYASTDKTFDVHAATARVTFYRF